MNANIFNIDFVKLVLWNIETFLRVTVRVKWLNTLIYPIVGLHHLLITFRNEQLYKMSHNSQIVFLEKVLNDNFDDTSREIYIQNTEIKEPVWFYNTNELKPVYHYDESDYDGTNDDKRLYYYDQADFDLVNTDFEVIIPLRLKPGTQDEIDAFEMAVKILVDYYKLYSKRYAIKYE